MIYNPSLRRLFNKLMLFANDFLKYRMHYGSNINLFISDDITVLKKTLTTKSVSSTQGRGRTKSEKKSTAAKMTEKHNHQKRKLRQMIEKSTVLEQALPQATAKPVDQFGPEAAQKEFPAYISLWICHLSFR